MRDKTSLSFCRLPMRQLQSCVRGILLIGVATNVAAGDIATAPLMGYPSGGHAFLVLFGNSASMTASIGDGSSKAYMVSQAVTGLLSDPTMMSAKLAASGQTNALGLMTYGGTSSKSPYYYSSVMAPLDGPYTRYAYEFTEFPSGNPLSSPPVLSPPNDTFLGYDLACNTLHYNYADWGEPAAPTLDTSFANFFYNNPDPTAHPYCLPVPYTRPTGYSSEDASCSSDWGSGDYEGNNKLCYGGAATPSAPTLGKVRVGVEKLPQDAAALSTRASVFATALSDAGNSGNRPIEGGLLTACDYFNTKWLDASGNSYSKCYRGYPPKTTNVATTPTLTGSDGASQGVTASTPTIAGVCDASIILITDGPQDTTADGQAYIPDFSLTEANQGYQPGVADLDDGLAFYGLPTDPTIIALYDLALQQGQYPVFTSVVGLGVADGSLDALARAGYNSNESVAYYSSSLLTLKTALDNIFSERFFYPLNIGGAGAAAAATNSTSVQTDTLVFQAQFQFARSYGGWYGDVVAFKIDLTSSNCVASGSCVWQAADKLSAMPWASRLIYTYNPDDLVGSQFLWDSLTTTQQAALGLNIVSAIGADDINYATQPYGQFLVDWLRGQYYNEDILFKIRNGRILGDIVNSDPAYTGNESFAYDILPGAAGSSYNAYLTTKSSRLPMLYVGANDGMLHGFNIGTSPDYADGGVEQFAYVPNALIGSNLVKYAARPPGGSYYAHVFGVDGPPTVGDAYIDGTWKTFLVGVTGAGAKSVFALDVSNPASFSASNVLWEISDSDAAAAVPISADASAIHGDLGYTLAQASIVRLNNGQWGAIVANGYDSANGHAVLFIFNVATGQLIKKIDTGVAGNTGDGGSVAKNGLSTPFAVDIDNNRTADYVYAGDLEGNLWKFNITGTSTAAWGVAYDSSGDGSGTPVPLFVACSSDPCTAANRQPITAKPNVGPGASTGLLVYFGTGKYFELGDNVVQSSPAPQTQSFYALWDNGSTISGRASLQVQTINQQLAYGGSLFRLTSANTVDYAGSSGTAQRGWYLDLLTPGGAPGADESFGERVIAFPLLRSGRVIFTTLIPSQGTHSCNFGGDTWIMEMDALSGGHLATPPWDLNNDGAFNDSDTPDGAHTPPSGTKSSIGIAKTPAVVKNGDEELKILSGTGDNSTYGGEQHTTQYMHESMGNVASSVKGRISWRQLQQ